MNIREQAEHFIAQIESNVETFWSHDGGGWDAFHRRQGQIWKDVDAAGPKVRAAVEAMLNGR